MLKKSLNIAIFTLLFSLTAMAQGKAPIIEAKLSSDSVVIGDQFKIEVTVNKDLMHMVEFPQFEKGKLSEQIEIIDESKIDTVKKDGREVQLRKEYTLTTFDEGVYSIGRFPILYGDKNLIDTLWSVDSMVLNVATFDIDTTKQKIYEIKPQQEAPVKFGEFSVYLLIGLLCALVLAAIIWLIIRKVRRSKGLIKNERKLPPHVTAIIALEELKNQKLWQSNKQKLYYTALTDIIREYLDGRYGVQAMEMTSDEILEAIKDSELSAKSYEELKTLLRSADLVKFAKMTMSVEDNESSFINAYYFVEETKPSIIDTENKEEEK